MDYEKVNTAQIHSEADSFTEKRYQQFYKFFPVKTKKVLDVGCNTGRGGAELYRLDKKLEISGLDCVDKRLQQLPDEIYKHRLLSYSTNIKAKDDSYDVIVAGEFIEHLSPHDVTPTLVEFYRILKIKGRLLLTTPNPDYIRLKLTGGTVLHGAHLSAHNHKELSKELNDIGFKKLEVLGSGKISKLIGQYFPFLSLYGSYMIIAEKYA